MFPQACPAITGTVSLALLRLKPFRTLNSMVIVIDPPAEEALIGSRSPDCGSFAQVGVDRGTRSVSNRHSFLLRLKAGRHDRGAPETET